MKETRASPEACRIVRHSLDAYFLHATVDRGPRIAPAELSAPAAVFVSLWSGDELRGCMGTIEPFMPTAAREIAFATLEAATADPLRRPLHRAELEAIDVGVSVLGDRRALGHGEAAERGEALELRDAAGRVALCLPGCGSEEDAHSAGGLSGPVVRHARAVTSYGRVPGGGR